MNAEQKCKRLSNLMLLNRIRATLKLLKEIFVILYHQEFDILQGNCETNSCWFYLRKDTEILRKSLCQY